MKAGTGEQIWKFEPFKDDRLNSNRGVVYWESGSDKRILYTVGSGLYAVNAVTGEIVKSFGQEGRVDIHAGLQTNMDHDVSKLSVNATSPGIVFKNTFILGSGGIRIGGCGTGARPGVRRGDGKP